MRILLVNWANLADGAASGGGVNGYCLSLGLDLAALGHDVVYLSSGQTYRSAWWRKTPGPIEIRRLPDIQGIRIFGIVNSPVLSPSFFQFNDPEGEISAPALEAVVADFCRAVQPDVVHFHNIEGFSADCVDAVRATGAGRPAPKVLFSVHNYHSVCPQVNLLKGGKTLCENFDNGHACVKCMDAPDVRKERARRALETRLGGNQFHALRHIFHDLRLLLGLWKAPPSAGEPFDPATCAEPRIATPPPAGDLAASPRLDWTPAHNEARPEPASDKAPNAYARRRKAMIAAMNRCDRVLAVSEFVRAKCVALGVRKEIVQAQTIGIRLPQIIEQSPEVLVEPGPVDPERPRPLKLIFLGYNNPAKGLPMLADALDMLEPRHLSRFHLHLHALNGTAILPRFRRLEARLAGLTFADGYRYDEIPSLCAGKDVGIVPSIWWDNGPQTVMEFLACRVPVLGADMGGIPDFVSHDVNGLLFRGNDRVELARHLARLATEHDLLPRLRAGIGPVKRMDEHAREMVDTYASVIRGQAPPPPRPRSTPARDVSTLDGAPVALRVSARPRAPGPAARPARIGASSDDDGQAAAIAPDAPAGVASADKEGPAARVAVVIATYNRFDVLEQCLRDVSEQDHGAGNLDVIVVDNGSPDATPDRLRERWGLDQEIFNDSSDAASPAFVPRPRDASPALRRHPFASLTLIRNGVNLGGSGAFTTGMIHAHARSTARGEGRSDDAASPARFLWLCDDDARFAPDTLRRMVDTARADPAVGVVGARSVDPGDRVTTLETTVYLDPATGDVQDHAPAGHPLAAAFEAWIASVGQTRGARPYSGRVECDIVAACCTLARMSALEAAGPWDARYFIYEDDAEWCLRLKSMGWKVVMDLDAVVYHAPWHARLTPELVSRRLYYAQRNRLWTLRRLLPPDRRHAVLVEWLRNILADAMESFDRRAATRARLLVRAVEDACADRGGPLAEPLPASLPLVAALREAGLLGPGARAMLLVRDRASLVAARALRAAVDRMPLDANDDRNRPEWVIVAEPFPALDDAVPEFDPAMHSFRSVTVPATPEAIAAHPVDAVVVFEDGASPAEQAAPGRMPSRPSPLRHATAKVNLRVRQDDFSHAVVESDDDAFRADFPRRWAEACRAAEKFLGGIPLLEPLADAHVRSWAATPRWRRPGRPA
jgi:GT2 family glycosyltransferase/glycosyltransferase involved in cell wall biosynthesis